MAQPEITQNQFPEADLSLKDLLDIWRKQLLLDLSCHHLATIEEFFPDTQTATVQISYKKTRFTQDSVGNMSTIYEDYPPLTEVPVVFLGGGPGALTFPVEQGDQCILLINDRAIDTWYSGSNGQPVPISRYHALADAIALIGVRSQNTVLSDFDADRVRLYYQDGGEITLGDKVGIQNQDQNLKDLLTQLCSQLTTLNGYLQTLVTQTAAITVTGVTPGGGVSGIPANAAAITAISTNIGNVSTSISQISTDLGELLE